VSDDIWSEYLTIATHPSGARLVRHPNCPAIVQCGQLSTIGYVVRAIGENGEAIKAADFAEWVALALFHEVRS
jgi:hypothetical protein